jgi:hypothetical protein
MTSLTHPPTHSSTHSALTAANPESINPAVARCIAAFQRTQDLLQDQQSDTEPFDDQFVIEHLVVAYREAMPPLSGHDNICDFIACVAHAMLKEIFDPRECQLYLNAARTALAACRARDRSQAKQEAQQP